VRRLLNFIVLFKEYFVLSVIALISFFLMAVSRSEQVQPLRAIATVIVGTLQSSYNWIPNPFGATESVDELREKNIALSSELSRLRRAKAENDEFRKLLALKPREGWKLLAAEVVGKTSTGDRNMITLSVGENDGVRKGMAVITDAGLVGRVYALSGGFSLIEGLYNRQLRIAVKIARTRVDGILTWDGTDILLVRNVPKALDVQEGDMVVTSEYSSFFPSDVPVGVVTKLEAEPNSLFRRIYIAPFAYPGKLEHVFVVIKDEQLERQKEELEKKAEEEAKKSQQKKK
jgi:rod shape-determining protein MreC